MARELTRRFGRMSHIEPDEKESAILTVRRQSSSCCAPKDRSQQAAFNLGAAPYGDLNVEPELHRIPAVTNVTTAGR